MQTYQVAHIREKGQDIIIVVVHSSFGSKSSAEQAEHKALLQERATQAGLKGIVVPVWDNFGRVKSLPPPPWAAFFRGITWDFVRRNINRELQYT